MENRKNMIFSVIFVTLVLMIIANIILAVVFIPKLMTLPAPWNTLLPICQVIVIILLGGLMYDTLGFGLDEEIDDE